MAVQQNKKTRSRRGMRRSHDALSTSTLTVDQTSGETRRRHHVSADGFYRGKKVVETGNDEYGWVSPGRVSPGRGGSVWGAACPPSS